MEKKYYNYFYYDINEPKQELTIVVCDSKGNRKSVATLCDCPTKNMSKAQIDAKYDKTALEILEDLGYEQKAIK